MGRPVCGLAGLELAAGPGTFPPFQLTLARFQARAARAAPLPSCLGARYQLRQLLPPHLLPGGNRGAWRAEAHNKVDKVATSRITWWRTPGEGSGRRAGPKVPDEERNGIQAGTAGHNGGGRAQRDEDGLVPHYSSPKFQPKYLRTASYVHSRLPNSERFFLIQSYITCCKKTSRLFPDCSEKSD